MRSLIFEGKTWLVYEELREKNSKLDKNLCKLLTEMLRGNPTSGMGKPEALKHNSGIIIVPQKNAYKLARRISILVRALTADEIKNQLLYA